jgi:hypothetical protein
MKVYDDGVLIQLLCFAYKILVTMVVFETPAL